jgi:hypothetical protein
MSERWSDAELIRICLEGSADELTDEVIEALQQRLSDSLLIRETVRESPHAEALVERLEFPEPQAQAEAPVGRRKLIACLALLAVTVGLVVWFKPQPPGPDEKPPVGDVADSDVGPDQERPDGTNSETVAAAQTPAESSPDEPGSDTEPVETPDTTPVVKAVDPESEEPWAKALSPDAAPRRFEDVAWLLPGMEDNGEFPPTEFRRWFEPVPGLAFNVSEHKHGTQRFTHLDGGGRLRAPWVDGAVLRLAVYDTTSCDLFCWNGNTGLRLRLYRTRTPHRWAVHRVTRKDANSPAETGELLTTDCGRWHRSYYGPFDLRWENGELIMARGSVRMLTVPYPQSPGEIVLAGKLRIRQLTMFRSDPMPPVAVPLAETSPPPSDEHPAGREWKVAEGTGFRFEEEVLPDVDGNRSEAVELVTTAETTAMAWASTPVENPGLSEFIFRIDHADPGTGIHLGAADGTPVFRLNVVRDTKTKRSGFMLRYSTEVTIESAINVTTDPAPWMGESQWIRLAFHAGCLSAWISPDGVHWGQLGEPRRSLPGRFATVGVFAHKGAARTIRLRHVSSRKLPMFASLANANLVDQVDAAAFEPLDLLDIGAWMHRVIRTRPSDVDLFDWRRACAVACLQEVPSTELQIFLVNGLLAEGLFNGEPGDTTLDNTDGRVWRLLNEAAILCDGYDGARAIHLTQLWHEVTRLLARQAADAGFGDDGESPTLDSMEALLRSEFISTYISPLTAQDAADLQLTALVEAGDRDEQVLDFIDKLAFWNTNSHPSHSWWSPVDPIYSKVVWAELAAHRSLNGEEQAERFSLPRRWKTALVPNRHSLAQRVSKEAYNVMAEFQAAIDGNAFKDACQVIASSSASDLIGLLPDGKDRRLLVSFPNAVALAMDRYPPLRVSMNEKFGAVGRLRVRQAIESGDSRQIEAATVQYYGTVAAAESEFWLGDRALAAGRFTEARSYYGRALDGFRRNSLVNTQETAGLASRLRLTAALIGDPAAETEDPAAPPATTAVNFGGTKLTADQFEKLVTEMTARAPDKSTGDTLDSGQSRSSSSLHTAARLPGIAGYKTEVRGRHEGDMGDRAGQSAPAIIDWVARQMAIEIEGNEAILTNRFQVSSIDLTTGLLKWRRDIGADHGYAHQWPMLPMRPLLTPEAVFCRWVTKRGVELVRLARDSGNIMWSQKPPQPVASDPILVRGRLVAFAVDQQYAGPKVLTLLTIHPKTGTILSAVPVLQMFDVWPNATQVCQVTAHDGRIYATVAGVVLCCDGQGQTIWVRRRDAISPALDARHLYTRTWVPPLVDGDRLIVTQPECPTIECLDIQTGRVLWQHVSLDLQRIVAKTDNRLFTQTRAGLECLDVKTGRSLWMYPAADLLDGLAVLDAPPPTPAAPVAGAATPEVTEPPPTSPGLLITRRIPFLEGNGKQFVPALVWLDAETGHEMGRHVLKPLMDVAPYVGPILITPEKQWIFFGKGQKTPQREIHELLPDPMARPTITLSERQWGTWHPEFRLASYTDNRTARPHLTRRELAGPIHSALQQVCPGWLMLAKAQPKEAGLRPDHRGQKNALAMQAAPRTLTEDQWKQLGDTPVDAVRLIREVSIPDVPNAVLKFRAGHDASQNWKLTVEADGQRLYSALVNDETAPTGWQVAHVSMDHLAGQTVRLVMTCSAAERKAVWVYLSQFETAGDVAVAAAP